MRKAARPGFEPGLTAPKADVLPLHHRAMAEEGEHLDKHRPLAAHFILTHRPATVKGKRRPANAIMAQTTRRWRGPVRLGVEYMRAAVAETPSDGAGEP